MVVRDLVKLVGMGSPLVYSAPRGESIMYFTGYKLDPNNRDRKYWLVVVLVDGSQDKVLEAWYEDGDDLTDFAVVDYV